MRIHSPQITGSAANTNIVLTTVTSSISVLSSSFAATASSADNLTVRGTLTAQTINVQTITSSIEFVTGSTRNGSTTANTHQFTGSVSITGSLQVNESNVILTNQTSSMSVATASYWSGSIINAATASYVENAQSASYVQNAQTASYVLQAQSASYWSGSIINAATASYVLNAVSASFALTASYISGSGAGVGFPFSGSAIITGSLFVSGSTISGSFKGDGSQITGLTAGGKIHTQTSAASTWTVSHNLGVQYPNVTVYDNNNNVIIPQTIVATDANTLTLTFGSAVAGYAVAGIGGIINVQGRTTQQYFTASTTWSFAHNLGDKYVSLQAFDDAFEMVIPTTIRLVDFTSSLLLFDSASSGYAVATIGGDLPAISSSYAGYTLQVASSAPYSASWVAVPNVTVTNAVSSSFAATASSADNLTVRGTLTAQTINVQTITSSIEFVTGSTRNGSLSTNTHEFTGSVSITGSGTATKLIVASDANAGTIDFGTGIYKGIMDYSAGSGLWRLNNQSAGAASTLYYQFQSDGTASMSILKNGNVGIGTTAPSAKLDVRGADIYLNISDTIDSRYVNLGNWIAGRTTLEVGSGDLFIKTQTSNYLAFGTFNTERMRITSAGSVLVNTTSLPSTGSFNSYSNSGLPAGRFVGGPSQPDGNITLLVDKYSSTNTTSQWFLGFTLSNQTVASGVITANGASQAAFGSWSDRRLKENIVDLPNQLSNILALRPVEFDYIESEGGGHQTSFIAQEFEEIYPDAIGERPDGMKTLTGWGKTEAILVKAIQELSAKNTTLEERLTALENK